MLLGKRAKTGELRITLLDMNSCDMDGRTISETDTFRTQLGNQLIVNVVDDLFCKGTCARCAMYQAIGQQNILL